MLKKLKAKLATGFVVKPLRESPDFNIATMLSAHKEQHSGRHIQSPWLKKLEDEGTEHRVFLANLQHLLLCADICEFGWEAVNPKDANKVDRRHAILRALLREMESQGIQNESLALTALVGLAGEYPVCFIAPNRY